MTLGCKDIKIRQSELVVKIKFSKVYVVYTRLELVVKIKFSKVYVVYTRLELRMRKKEAAETMDLM